MSPGGIAVLAIIISGTEVLTLIAAGAWLVYTKRIMLAATPKPQAPPQPGREAAAKTPKVPASEPPVRSIA